MKHKLTEERPTSDTIIRRPTRRQLRKERVRALRVRRAAIIMPCCLLLSLMVGLSTTVDATPSSRSSMPMAARLDESAKQSSRSMERLTLATSLTGGDWQLGDDNGTDGRKLSLLHADNPTISQLINGRDENQTPEGWDPDHATGDAGNGYPYGQCTWWAYKRRAELGLPTASHFGNGGQWTDAARRLGYWVDSTPRVGDAVVFKPGQQGADPTYGHVAVVENVDDKGNITISEANVNGKVGPFNRTITADKASQLEYVHY